MDKTRTVIEKCKNEIISKYLGINNYNLKHTDFLKLSDEIYNATNISISISTLRRVFKENFSGYPQISTLDAFAKYLGYNDWKTYLKENTISNEKGLEINKRRLIPGKKVIYGISGTILIALILYLIYFKFKSSETNYENVEFSYQDFDHTEMPVTVYFRYNLHGIKCDSASIQPLGWATAAMGDEFSIDPSDSIASYSYLWPEPFTAKLTVDGKIVKQLKIKLVTNTWKASLSNMKNTFYVKYFDDKEIYTQGKLAFSDNVLINNNFSKDDIEKTAFHLFKDFHDIDGDTLHFETRIKNCLLVRTEEGGNTTLFLFFENAMIQLPLALVKSIQGELHYIAINKYFSSKKNNLSFLYTNLEEWNLLRIETNDKTFKLSINDSLVFETKYDINAGKLTGIRYVFNGMGEVDYVRFYNNDNRLIYNDEFDH